MRTVSLMLAAGLCLAASPVLAALSAGADAPAFTIDAAQGGKTFSFDLAAALKRGPVVLYFYPKSFTSVCTQEAHDFAESMPAFQAAGTSVIGVSADKIDVQREFSSKECRDTFPVGADPKFSVIRAYDAAMTIPGTNIGFAKRISYVIAPNGTILSTLSDSDAAPHIKNALAAVDAWRKTQGH